MLKKIVILIVIAAAFSACLQEEQSNPHPACGTQACTKEFRTVAFKFLDKNGSQISVNSYRSVNMRTNMMLHNDSVHVPGSYPPYYNVANDSDLAKLSDDGDSIEITGTNSVTGQTKTAVVKVSGGCNCHISKVSGPDSLKFDQ